MNVSKGHSPDTDQKVFIQTFQYFPSSFKPNKTSLSNQKDYEQTRAHGLKSKQLLKQGDNKKQQRVIYAGGIVGNVYRSGQRNANEAISLQKLSSNKEEQINRLKLLLMQYESRIQFMNKDCIHAGNRQRQLKAQIQKYKQNIDLLVKEIQRLNITLSKQNENINNLKETESRISAENKKLSLNFNQQKRLIDQLLAEKDKRGDHQTTQKHQRTVTDVQVNSHLTHQYQSRLYLLSNQLERIQKILLTKEKEIEDCKRQCQAYLQQLRFKEAIMGDLQQLKKRKQELDRQINQLDRVLQSRYLELQYRRNKIQDLFSYWQSIGNYPQQKMQGVKEEMDNLHLQTIQILSTQLFAKNQNFDNNQSEKYKQTNLTSTKLLSEHQADNKNPLACKSQTSLFLENQSKLDNHEVKLNILLEKQQLEMNSLESFCQTKEKQHQELQGVILQLTNAIKFMYEYNNKILTESATIKGKYGKYWTIISVMQKDDLSDVMEILQSYQHLTLKLRQEFLQKQKELQRLFNKEKDKCKALESICKKILDEPQIKIASVINGLFSKYHLDFNQSDKISYISGSFKESSVGPLLEQLNNTS